MQPEWAQPEDARWRTRVSRKWAYQISSAAYVPSTLSEIESETAGLLDDLLRIVYGNPFDPAPAVEVGRSMVEYFGTSQKTFDISLRVITDALLAAPGLSAAELGKRVSYLLAPLASGYASAMQARTLAQQEEIKTALVKALRAAKDESAQAREALESLLRSLEASAAAMADEGGKNALSRLGITVANWFGLKHPPSRRNLTDEDIERLALDDFVQAYATVLDTIDGVSAVRRSTASGGGDSQ